MFNVNGIVNALGGMAQINKKLDNFGNNLRSQFGQNVSPEQLGQQLLNSGQLSQQKFEEFRQVANFITGRNV